MTNRAKRRKIKIESASTIGQIPVPIVGDGAIARADVGDGRLIPVLILDLSERIDIANLIRNHDDNQPGDVVVAWGWRTRNKRLFSLIVQFKRPIEALLFVEFEISRHGTLIESILTSQGVYFQDATAGDRVSSSLDGPRLLVEVPDTRIRGEWNRMWKKALARELRRRGLKRRESIDAADAIIAETRKLLQHRMRS